MDMPIVEIARPVFQVMLLTGIVTALAVRYVQCGAQRAVDAATGRGDVRGTHGSQARRKLGRTAEGMVQTDTSDEEEPESRTLEEMALMNKPKVNDSRIRNSFL